MVCVLDQRVSKALFPPPPPPPAAAAAAATAVMLFHETLIEA